MRTPSCDDRAAPSDARADPPAPAPPVVGRSPRERRAVALVALAVLAAALQRGVTALAAEGLRADLWLPDTRLGLATSAFTGSALLAIALAGRLRRGGRAATALAAGSAATLLCAAVRGFAGLLAARALAGLGAAAAALLALALLRGAAPERRAGAGAAVLAALLLGLAAAFVAGGTAQALSGWRTAFAFAGAAGLAVAFAVRRLPEAAGAREIWRALHPSAAATLPALAAPGRRLAIAGGSACAFAASALATWLPAFLERARGVPRTFAAVQAGAALVMALAAGVAIAWALVPALRRRRVAEPERWTAAIAAAAAAPLAVAALVSRAPTVYLPALVLALALLVAAVVPAAAALLETLPPPSRAAGGAMALLLVVALGDLPAPLVVGAVSDRSSLGRALLLVPAALAVAAAAFGLWARRSGRARQPERASS